MQNLKLASKLTGNRMFGLQEIFDKQMKRDLRSEDFMLKLIKEKLSNFGIRLNRSQTKIIRQQLKGVDPEITFDFTDDQVAHARIKPESDFEKAIQTSLSNIPSEAIEQIQKLMDELPGRMERLAEKISDLIFKKIRRTYRFGLKDRRDIQSDFEKNLLGIWGMAISQLEVLVGLSIEAGENMVDLISKGKTSLTETKWEVLSRLHARASQIAGEIVVLLKAGFADGAQARWRSLHEVSVVLAFIFDNEDSIAQQYLMHDSIEEYKSAVHELELYPEISDNEEFLSYLDSLKTTKSDLIKSYGRYFKEDYGWAVGALKDCRPTFREIEKMVNLSYLRPYYREASYNVHANARGIFFRLGLHPDINDVLLAGSSDFGLATPGHLTALSLSHASITLLQCAAVIDSMVFMKVAYKQQQIVGKEFWRISRSMTKKMHAQPRLEDGRAG